MSASKLLALTTLFLATTFALTEWKEFTSPDGNFRVLFPDNPQQQTVTERNLHEFSATADSESYGLAYADYPPDTDWQNAVNGERDSIVNGLGGSVVDEKRTAVEGYPGGRARVDHPGPEGNARQPGAGCQTPRHHPGHLAKASRQVQNQTGTGH